MCNFSIGDWADVACNKGQIVVPGDGVEPPNTGIVQFTALVARPDHITLGARVLLRRDLSLKCAPLEARVWRQPYVS